jgi:flotillin
VAQGLQLGTDLTGIDLAALLARLGGGSSEDAGANGRSGRPDVTKAVDTPTQR